MTVEKSCTFQVVVKIFVVTEKAPCGIYGPTLVELLLCHELLDELQGLRLCRAEFEQTVLHFLHPSMAASK
jgi:hypothetical protein